MKKLLAALLTLSILFSLAACGAGTDTPQEQAPVPAVPSAPAAEAETEAETAPPVPEEDFGGVDFNVLAACEQWQDFYVADQTGDVVNDAVYERNLWLEEYNNIKLAYRIFNGYTAGMADVSTALSGSVMGGSGDYDMLLGSVSYVAPHISGGLLTDMNGFDRIDFSRPWWYRYADEQLEIVGRQYLASGAAGLNTVAWSIVTFFSKNLAVDYGIGDLYETVRSGEWTFDKLNTLGSSAVTDLDGNGKIDKNDRVGLVSTDDYMALETSAMGYFYSEKTAEGEVVLKELNERLLAINDILLGLEDSDTYLSGSAFGGADSHENYRNIQGYFANGGALFMIHRLDFATWDTMRDMENFGILPSPKYDAAQESYITPTVNDAVGIPAYVKDADMSAAVTEAMQYRSAVTVKPAYFETAIKRKSSRDEESVEMLEIIGSTCASDFMYIFSRDVGDIINTIANANYASNWEKSLKVYTKKMAKLIETVKGLET